MNIKTSENNPHPRQMFDIFYLKIQKSVISLSLTTPDAFIVYDLTSMQDASHIWSLSGLVRYRFSVAQFEGQPIPTRPQMVTGSVWKLIWKFSFLCYSNVTNVKKYFLTPPKVASPYKADIMFSKNIIPHIRSIIDTLQ